MEHWHVNGVTGHGLNDGTSTIATRIKTIAPHLTAGVTIDAWVAIDGYPWNWVPVVDHRSEEQAGYWCGIDSFGHVGMNVAVNGQWWTLFSKSQVPLKKWSHVAGTYDPAKGMAIYIDGKPVGNLSVQGPLTVAEREDLVIGRVRQATLPAQWIHPKLPVWFSFDGIMDDIRIFDHGLEPGAGSIFRRSSSPRCVTLGGLAGGPAQAGASVVSIRP
jgi:hypothetical protein